MKKKKNILIVAVSVLLTCVLVGAVIFIDKGRRVSELEEANLSKIEQDQKAELREQVLNEKREKKEQMKTNREEGGKGDEFVEVEKKVESKEDVQSVVSDIEKELEQMNEFSF